MHSVDYAKQKVKAVLDCINSVMELDFPYEDPRAAVRFIREIFEKHRAHLVNVSDIRVARPLCKQIAEDIDNFLLAIGFIVRACDVSGALELRGPLARLTHLAISSDVKLVLSSEWRISPFTLLYPGDFGNNFVLVGLPVSEAGNPLIAPLAGHELGHNVWRRLMLADVVEEEVEDELLFADDVEEKIESKVKETIKGDLWEEFLKTFPGSKKEDLDAQPVEQITPWDIAKAWGVLQCEEMFCDFFGLAIFGGSYLHALQFLLSPGGGLRNPKYPGTRDRIGALIRASEAFEFSVPMGFMDEFDDSDIDPETSPQLLLSLSDMASKELIPCLIDAVKRYCKKKELMQHDPHDVARIVESFIRLIPATNATSLSNIINAAWDIFLDPKNHWAADYRVTVKKPEKRDELIRELALKSFEVFEIEKIQEKSRAPVKQRNRQAPRRP